LSPQARQFRIALVVSLGLHAILLVLVLFYSGGSSGDPIQIYTVRIMEAPSQPKARELDLSTSAISALKLESPSLRPDAPPAATPDSPEIPQQERFLPSLPQPEPAADSRETAPGAEEPPRPDGVQPKASEQPAPPAELPNLPGRQVARLDKGDRREPSAALPPQPPGLPEVDEKPESPGLMERTRGVLRKLNLELEATPSRPAATSRVNRPNTERNLLALRLYKNRVREAVKEQFTFPGGFALNTPTRVRVELERDGSIRQARVIESSGDTRFDNLVCMKAIHNAKMPPIPRDVEEDLLILHFICSPNS
jgi:hypothetical protein